MQLVITLCTDPSERHLSELLLSDHINQMSQTLGVKHARVWYRSHSVSTLLLPSLLGLFLPIIDINRHIGPLDHQGNHIIKKKKKQKRT